MTEKNWFPWMRDYSFGTLVFLPAGELKSWSHDLRKKYDPVSAKTCPPHLTITQPFARTPSKEEVNQIKGILSNFGLFSLQIGPALPSPNGKLIWLDVLPKQSILNLRAELHALGIFRTDLAFTETFIPHLTISELSRPQNEVSDAIHEINKEYAPAQIVSPCLSWIIPDEDFTFYTRLHMNDVT